MRLWAANSRDILADFLLTYVSVILTYAAPFFLRSVHPLLLVIVDGNALSFKPSKILSSLEKPNTTREDRSNAYVFAVLTFICTLLKVRPISIIYCLSIHLPFRGQGQSDVQHLWRGRRAATRIRSELMAAIYDKALKRKDYSGIIDKDKQKEAADKKADANDTAHGMNRLSFERSIT
jgi:hypothetical protein